MIIIRLDFFSLVERNCRKIAQSRGTVVSRRILFTKPGPHGVRVFFSTLDIKSDGVRATSVTSGWRIGVRTQEIRQFPARARSCLHLIGAPVTSSPGGGGVLGALFRARRPSHADRSMRPSCTSPLSNASPFFETHVSFRAPAKESSPPPFRNFRFTIFLALWQQRRQRSSRGSIIKRGFVSVFRACGVEGYASRSTRHDPLFDLYIWNNDNWNLKFEEEKDEWK